MNHQGSLVCHWGAFGGLYHSQWASSWSIGGSDGSSGTFSESLRAFSRPLGALVSFGALVGCRTLFWVSDRL